MSDETLRQALIQAIYRHRWEVGGGTATGAWWRCSCGADGMARSGLREDADLLGATHVADAYVVAAVSAYLGDPA